MPSVTDRGCTHGGTVASTPYPEPSYRQASQAHHLPQGALRQASLPTGVFAIGDSARWRDLRGGSLVRIEHWILAQRQGQAVARTIVGDRAPFTDVPFFWSQHYDVSINYVSHAERWDVIEAELALERAPAALMGG